MMIETKPLITRARELAKLREKATPGPWVIYWEQDAIAYPGDIIVSYRAAHTDYSVITHGVYNSPVAELIAAAPEMAQLLGEMGDAVEKLSSWLDSLEAVAHEDVPIWAVKEKLIELGLAGGGGQ